MYDFVIIPGTAGTSVNPAGLELRYLDDDRNPINLAGVALIFVAMSGTTVALEKAATWKVDTITTNFSVEETREMGHFKYLRWSLERRDNNTIILSGKVSFERVANVD